jgi:glutamine amidotransferase
MRRLESFDRSRDRKLPTPNSTFIIKAPIEILESNKSFLKNITKDDYFYFLHSYYVNLTNELYVEAQSFYGNNFCSILRKENIFGVQFHPEKSHNSGLVLLKNFYEMNI